MSDCANLVAQAGTGVAPTLQAVDCMTANAGAGSFAHLFGPTGVLAPALTVALTIYVAAYGLGLITGRVRLGLGGLSGRMLTLGLVLAFSTSWAVYAPLVTTLATRAPDDLAGAILGTRGSATGIFAARIDTVFAAVNDATQRAADEAAERNAQAAAAQATPGAAATVPSRAQTGQNAGFAPASVASAGAMILLLSTVGVLVTSRIVLAALLLAGPVFVVMALFAMTRGLFAGWCRTVALAAFAPLLVVLGGAFSLELAVPAVSRLLGPDGIDGNAATGFFLIATVHAALMVMALRAVSSLVGGWKPWGPELPDRFVPGSRADPATMVMPLLAGSTALRSTAVTSQRNAETMPGLSRSTSLTTMTTTRDTRGPAPALPVSERASSPRRATGIGSRFRAAPVRQVVR
jgi:type IV secretion system protein VirB6